MNYDARIDTSRVAVLHGLQAHGEGVVGLLELSRLLRLLAAIGPREQHTYPEKDSSAYDRAWPMMVSLREHDLDSAKQDDKPEVKAALPRTKRRYSRRFCYGVTLKYNGSLELVAFVSQAARRRQINLVAANVPSGSIRTRKAEAIDVYCDFTRDEIVDAKNEALRLELLAEQ